MKRTIKYVTTFIGTFLMLFNLVNAESIKLKGDSSFTGDEFSVILEISSTKDVAGIQFPITWDEEKIEIISTYDKNKDAKHENLSIYNFTFPAKSGENLLLDAAKTKTGTIEVAKIHIQAKENFKVGETTTITLSDGLFAGMNNNSWGVKGTSFTIKREGLKEETKEENKEETKNPEKEENNTNNSSDNPKDQTNEPFKDYSCKKIDGTYYDKNGKAVSKEQHEKECLKNVDTGYFIPSIGTLIILAGYIFIKKEPLKRI